MIYGPIRMSYSRSKLFSIIEGNKIFLRTIDSQIETIYSCDIINYCLHEFELILMI